MHFCDFHAFLDLKILGDDCISLVIMPVETVVIIIVDH